MEALLRKNEAEINETAAKALLTVFGVIFLISLFCWIGIFDIQATMTVILLIVAFVTLVIPAFAVLKMHIYSQWIKYLIITCASVMASTAYVVFTFQAVLVFVVPSVIAVMYLDKKLMCFSGIVTTAAIFVSHIISAIMQYQPWLEPFRGMEEIVRYGAMPRFLQYAGCFALLMFISERYRKLLLQLSGGDREETDEETDEEKQEFEKLMRCLSEREKSVFMLIIGGFTNMQIADRLCLSNGTVKNYVSVVYDKLGIRERNLLILKYGRFYEENDRGHTEL